MGKLEIEIKTMRFKYDLMNKTYQENIKLTNKTIQEKIESIILAEDHLMMAWDKEEELIKELEDTKLKLKAVEKTLSEQKPIVDKMQRTIQYFKDKYPGLEKQMATLQKNIK